MRKQRHHGMVYSQTGNKTALKIQLRVISEVYNSFFNQKDEKSDVESFLKCKKFVKKCDRNYQMREDEPLSWYRVI